MNDKNLNANISNFTCTFMVDGIAYPLLDYFENIFYPALSDKSLFKSVTSTKTTYHITDLKLIKINDDVIALTGKHVKRTILEISEDYSIKDGFFGSSKKEPSAPYATFILTLNNHRLIYYKNKKGAPSVSNFQSTCRKILSKYTYRERKKMKDEFFKNKYSFNGKQYKYVKDFSEEILDKIYPKADLNIVAIESENLVTKKFEEITKISSVIFRFHPTNNEPLNYDSVFEKGFAILKDTESNSMNQTLNSPKNKDAIKNAIMSSNGRTDYTINAKNNYDEPIVITPNHVSETFSVSVDLDEDIEKTTVKVYNQLKDNEALKLETEENKSLFNKLKSRLIALL
ncbi:hypothetical protein P3F01_05615 [Clostridium perfringens]|uniref:hypothetical protein n=1 Tax=Clostridium perfringens TaxID=1502 RepID=UPI0028E0BEBD|nr:hypothetical protein [Clostridium perfringens]MDT9335860.1 hypothetical protein [Clostridium perfringens]MDT9343617.1 hypothetical protein [Clostridium perfringens]MDT9346798.1 hypothetical protein [Clostridium perfringens]MDT9352703.1 hypothetical protein [Clostridium perfringens]